MIQPITSGAAAGQQTNPISQFKLSPLGQSNSSLSSSKKIYSPSYFRRIISFLFFPFIYCINKIIDRIAPTEQEVELIKDLKNDLIGAVVFLIDHSEGAARLQKVLKACDHLYQKLERKWFSNNERAIFLRGSLFAIKLGAYIVLGERKKAEACWKTLISHGIDLGEENRQYLSFILSHTEKGEKNAEKIALLNLCAKIGLKIGQKYDRSTPENREKIQTWTIVAQRVLDRIEKDPESLKDIETLHKITKFALKYEKTYLGKAAIQVGKAALWVFKKIA